MSKRKVSMKQSLHQTKQVYRLFVKKERVERTFVFVCRRQKIVRKKCDPVWRNLC